MDEDSNIPTVTLGRTGVEVPAVSFGTWPHSGPNRAGKHPVGWSGHDDEAAAAALARGHRLGLTHWDTADVYGDGRAERLIGSLWGRVPRGDIFLASKVGWEPGDFGHPYHPKQMRRQAERSLKNLAVDHIDLYYFHRCHFGDADEYFDDAMEVMLRLREEGKVRFRGLSDWDSGKVARWAPRVEPDVVQPYRNAVHDTWEESGLKAWVDEHGAGVAFFSPLRHGLLLGKHEEPPDFGEGDHRSRIRDFRDPDALAHYRACRRAVEERFDDHPQPVLHALVGALLTDAPTACVLVGLRHPAQVEAAATAGQPLSPEDAAWVRALYREPRRDQATEM